MHTPLTDEELGQIESTITDEHLTPGPWDLAYEACDCGGDYPCGHGPYVTGVITPVPTSIAADRCKRTGEEPRDYDFHRGEIGDFTEADWVLMVSARQNVGTLLAEVRRLRDEAAATRTKTLTVEADEIVAHCPDHGSRDGVWMDCHCAVADDMRRRAAASASAVAVSGGGQ